MLKWSFRPPLTQHPGGLGPRGDEAQLSRTPSEKPRTSRLRGPGVASGRAVQWHSYQAASTDLRSKRGTPWPLVRGGVEPALRTLRWVPHWLTNGEHTHVNSCESRTRGAARG